MTVPGDRHWGDLLAATGARLMTVDTAGAIAQGEFADQPVLGPQRADLLRRARLPTPVALVLDMSLMEPSFGGLNFRQPQQPREYWRQIVVETVAKRP
jgi:hypothetical protein